MGNAAPLLPQEIMIPAKNDPAVASAQQALNDEYQKIIEGKKVDVTLSPMLLTA